MYEINITHLVLRAFGPLHNEILCVKVRDPCWLGIQLKNMRCDVTNENGDLQEQVQKVLGYSVTVGVNTWTGAVLVKCRRHYNLDFILLVAVNIFFKKNYIN